ncbi:MAG TPA: serine hydrolase [Thermoanaerobaculia bacterium]|nr:serine hydrolase [Thermoanaerobaculia bacterium]
MRRATLSRTPPVLVLALLAGAAAIAQDVPSLAGFDRYVRQAVEDWETPGLAISVVADGAVVFAEGYGAQRLGAEGQGAGVDEHTLFAIGSTTKAMTAALVGMLVDEGKLAWGDPVIDHLPGFRLYDPVATREVQARDLLTHNAGLPNADYLWYEQDLSTDEIVRRLRFVEPAYSLRSGFIYQNIMYAAAGELIEAVSGQSWGEMVRTRIFEPLGMSRSVTSLADTGGRSNVAHPHDLVDGRLMEIENASVDPVAAAGAVWSSVHDMAQWMRFLLAGGVTPEGRRLLSEETIEALFRAHAIVGPEDFYPTARLTEPHWTTYGLGWFQADYRGRRVDFHTGSIDGMVALCGLIRDEGLGVYVLANRDHTELRHALMYRVFDLLDPARARGGDATGEIRDWSTELRDLYAELAAEGEEARREARERRVEGTQPTLPLERYTGRYQDPLYGVVEIGLGEDGGLRVGYGRRAGSVQHWNYDTFRVRWDARWRGESSLSFDLDRNGEVARLTLDGLRLARDR